MFVFGVEKNERHRISHLCQVWPEILLQYISRTGRLFTGSSVVRGVFFENYDGGVFCVL